MRLFGALEFNRRQVRIGALLACGLVAGLLLEPALAADAEEAGGLNRLDMLMGLFGGLALFLFGMEQMGDGLKAAAGERMKDILAKVTRNRILAAVTGAAVTAVIQSSSVTTVLVVGFVSAGLMNLTQSVGIIMGANVGTTITAQIVAFKVEEAALLMIAVGFGMLMLSKQDRVRHYGSILMGLGLVFFGMGIMSDSMQPLRTHQPFLDLMVAMNQPLLAILVGAAFTALVQSSSATTGIVIVMASQGFVSLEAGIALALGANVGTCVTAMLAALGKPREAVRAAVVHVLFNLLGAVLWLGFIDQLAMITTTFSPAYPELSGVARIAAETPRQIANANTLFNVVNTVLFLGFAGVFARLAVLLVPDQPMDERVLVRPKFLDEELIETPALALERVRFEIGHLGEIVAEMLRRLPDAFLSGRGEQFTEIAKMDDRVDLLETHIIRYMGQIRKRSLGDQESKHFVGLMHATDSLESIGDLVETDIVALGRKRLDEGVDASDTMRGLLSELYQHVLTSVELSVRAVRDNDQNAAQEVIALKAEIDRGVEAALEHQAGKLGEDDPKRLAIFRVEMELVEKLKQIHTLAKRIARQVLPPEIATIAA